jgi:hypothetical protein
VELDGYRDTTQRENLILQANLVAEFETLGFGTCCCSAPEAGDQQYRQRAQRQRVRGQR